ncbi:MAG: helix-turn-helix domain-containing protein [Moorea sp. SIO4A3]|nr:helix-turn-helix domain-containing protein [Moorena sp. SIO4A3]
MGLTYSKLAEIALLHPYTVKRFFAGKKIDISSYLSICNVLGLEPKDIFISDATE